jgi:dienelactone hydrolase
MSTFARGVAVLLLFAAGPAGCAGTQPLRFDVGPPTALLDEPLRVHISGARPGQRVQVDASTTDERGRTWSSGAAFVAGADGTVDVASTAPVGGSYTGVHDSGLIWSLRPEGTTDYYYVPQGNTMVLHLTLRIDGTTVGDAQVGRAWRAAGVTEQRLTPDHDGIDGVMFQPGGSGAPHPAVLVFGGSDGGLTTDNAELLASHGYPTLVIAYFGDAGLPDTLTDVPLEYFAKALRWLAGQPGVDPQRMAVAGVSRGSEAALLLGVNYPDLVHAVLALVPSSVVNSGLPELTKPAWTLNGAAVPFVPSNGLGGHWATAVDHPEAAIPVERIRGPIFLLCGADDQLWPSCPFSAQIADRRTANRVPYRDVRISAPAAGHFVGSPVPNIPASSGTGQTRYGKIFVGGTQQADALGRVDAWPRLLDFLAGLSS